MRLSILGSLRFALATAVALTTTSCAEQTAFPECDADNGGIQLPDGFCALVVADALGAARHLDVAPNGDIFVAIRNQQNAPGGIIALRDTDGDGRADLEERFGEDGGKSIQLRGDYLYFGRDNAIVRYPMTRGELVADGLAEVIATLPDQRSHASKGFAFDGEGGIYVNVGAPANAWQSEDREPGVPGMDPCPLLENHGGVWKFDADRPGQTQASALATRPACGRTSPWPGIRSRRGSTWFSTAAIS